MKKILFLIAIIITLSLNAAAQSDGFFRGDFHSENRDDVSSALSDLHAPTGALGTIPDSGAVPIGSGLLIMTVLGGALVLRKKLKE